MITVSMGAADARRTRFAFSPLAEVAGSLHVISSDRVERPYRGWFTDVRERLRRLDMPLLSAVVPPTRFVADFLFTGAIGTATTIEEQLTRVAETPVDVLRRDLEQVWGDAPIPDPALAIFKDPTGGPRRLADTLGRYWSIALESHWPSMRAVLEDDLAFRATEITKSGLGPVLAGLHRSISIDDNTLRIADCAPAHVDLGGAGMILVPAVFVRDRVIFVPRPSPSPTLTYTTRGVGNLWPQDERSTSDLDPLAALLGRTRAMILDCLTLPMSTTELARKLNQSAAAVSLHLGILRRSGLATSWRSGRRVLYRRTALADNLAANPGVISKASNA